MNMHLSQSANTMFIEPFVVPIPEAEPQKTGLKIVHWQPVRSVIDLHILENFIDF